MNTYTVHQLAELAGVSVRTLHHYDHIGLLTPAAHTAAGYRLYGEQDLLRLQQMLFFRELDLPLGEIKTVLADPALDRVAALREHRRVIEAAENWGEERVRASEQRVRRMSKEEWQAVQREGGEVTQALAALIDRDPADAQVQALIARHHAWIEHFYPAPAELYEGLGQHYAEHPEFRAFYERYAPNMADFMKAAMATYAAHTLRR